jgi:uncharacterized Zn finger protein
MQEFQEKIKRINDLLKKGEPHNWTKDHKGYAGYKPQFVIDAVNTEFSGQWSLELVGTHTFTGGRKDKNAKDIVEAFAQVRLTLGEAKIDAVASHPITDDYGDAIKSAQTDAMKKAFAHFSIGNRAYHGLLK